MKDLTVIIPFHEYTKENVELLKKAVDSVPSDMKIILCMGDGVNKAQQLKKIDNRIELVAPIGKTSFQDLVNAAVENVSTDWFSILEFDDTYTDIWFVEAERYMNERPSVSVFMPLEDIIDFKNGKMIGYGNEAAWASSFSNELGYLDNDCLNGFFDFYPTGSIFNTLDFKSIGGLKNKIKITFWYEWMLRCTQQGKQIYVVPKVGYNHYLNRDGSLTEQYKKEVNEDETAWWFDLAKKDSFFKEMKEDSYYVYKNKGESENE